MDQETQVSPDAETQNPAPELVQPEVTTPEPEATDDAPAEQAEDGDKTVKRMERRIQRLTSEKYQTRAEADAARRELESLRQRLAQYETPEEPRQQVDPLTLAREISKIERVAEKANSIAREGEKRFKDFKDAVVAVSREAGPMFDQMGRPTGLGEAVMSADDPAAVLHRLGTDPDLASELAELTPIQQARRIARLEAEMTAPKPAPVSKAPKPIEPVKPVKSSAESLSADLPIDEWAKRFYEQRRNR